MGSRMSMRHEWEGPDDGSSSQKGTLKGMFKKQKKSKQIELDALRWGQVWMGMYECKHMGGTYQSLRLQGGSNQLKGVERRVESYAVT